MTEQNRIMAAFAQLAIDNGMTMAELLTKVNREEYIEPALKLKLDALKKEYQQTFEVK